MRKLALVTLIIALALASCNAPAASGEFPNLPVTNTPLPRNLPTDPPPTGVSLEDTPAPEEEEEPTPEEVGFSPSFFQITDPGCCTDPFWSPDGEQVRFIDKPGDDAPIGIYGVEIFDVGRPFLVSERVGLPSPDGNYLAYLNAEGQTIVLDIGTGENNLIPNGGLRVFFSPDSQQVAWADTATTGNFDERRTVVGISAVNGSDSQQVTTLVGGGLVGWLDNETLLLAGRANEEDDSALYAFNIHNGDRTDLVVNHRVWSARISPEGEWIFYTIALDPNHNEEAEGLWIVDRQGERRYKMEVVGSALWRDPTRLVVIPMDIGEPSHRLWQFDAETGEIVPLTEPEITPFRVKAGQWSISPTGDYIVFLNEADLALWVIGLPPLDDGDS